MTTTTGKLAILRLQLSDFAFKVVHCVGIKHQSAETLSRLLSIGIDEYLLEGEAPVLMISKTQSDGGIAEVDTNILKSRPCNDGMNTVKPAFPESLRVSDGIFNEEPVMNRELVTSQTLDSYCRKIVTSVGKPETRLFA